MFPHLRQAKDLKKRRQREEKEVGRAEEEKREEEEGGEGKDQAEGEVAGGQGGEGEERRMTQGSGTLYPPRNLAGKNVGGTSSATGWG